MFLMQFFISIYDIYVYFKIKLFIMKGHKIFNASFKLI